MQPQVSHSYSKLVCVRLHCRRRNRGHEQRWGAHTRRELRGQGERTKSWKIFATSKIANWLYRYPVVAKLVNEERQCERQPK